MLPLHRRVPSALPADSASSASSAGPADPDMAWFTEYATMYQAEARECSGCADCDPPPYDGCFFPPAADPGRPAAYSALWTRDFEYTMEYLYPLFDQTSRQAALDQTLYIMRNRKAGNCSAPGGVACTNDEPMFQAKMVVNLANYTANRTLFCDHVDQLWFGLHSVYTSPQFKDGLVWTAGMTSGYGFTDSIEKSGHHTFDSVLHVQVLGQLVEMAARWKCGDAPAMQAAASRRRGRHSAAPPSPLSRCFNRDG